MSNHLTRRTFLVRGAGLAAGLTTVSLLRPTISLGQGISRAEDLVDAAEGFERGIGRGVALNSSPRGPTLQATQDGATFTSAVQRSAGRFTHVGLHWLAELPSRTGLQFELRTSPDGTSWSPWQAVKPNCPSGPEPHGERFGSLIYARDGQFLQYRVTFRTAQGASPRLQRVTNTVIDSPVIATSVATTPVSGANSYPRLDVVTRESWGADESYRFNKRGQEIWPEMFVPAKKLIIHHTATRNDYQNAAEAAAEVRAIYHYHAVTQRWGDVGYNQLLDKFGNIYEGRHGRGEGATREILSADVVAGHDYNYNYGSVGIALVGDATQADWPMRTAEDANPMWSALRDASAFEVGRHTMRPLLADLSTPAHSDFLRSDDLWSDGMNNVSGHRETNNTTCPGDVVMGLLGALRAAVHESLSGTSRTGVQVSTTSPGGRETTVGIPLVWTWTAESPDSGWTLDGYEYCIEGWSRITRSEDIKYLEGFTEGSQPYQQPWQRVGPEINRFEYTPSAAGHFTLHVRAVVTNSTGTRVSAYQGDHTYLVKASSSGGGRPPRSSGAR